MKNTLDIKNYTLILAEAFLRECSLNDAQYDQITHGIYWHHNKPYRKDDIFTSAEAIYNIFGKSLNKDKFPSIYTQALAVINDVISLAEKFEVNDNLPSFNKLFTLTEKPLPAYKNYDQLR